MEVRFEVAGEPKGKARPRFARIGNGVRTYTSAETSNYEAFIKMAYLNAAGKTKLNGAICAEITGIFPIPKSESKRRRQKMLSGEIPHTKKIDCDNLAKTILDALNGIAYDDDKQVCRLLVIKKYGEIPCVMVSLREVYDEKDTG